MLKFVLKKKQKNNIQYMKSASNVKIFIMRLSSIGDIVLTTGVVRMLRKVLPESEIHYVTDKKYSSLLKFNTNIHEVIEYDKSFGIKETLNFGEKLNEQITARDIVIDLHNNHRTRLIRRRLKGRTFSLDKHIRYKLMLVWLKKNIYGRAISIPELYGQTVRKALPFEDDGLGLEVWLEEDAKEGKYMPHSRVQANALRKIVVAPGATYLTKRWLPEYYGKLCEILRMKFDAEIFLIGGADDRDVAGPSERAGAINLCGKLNLLESARIIRESDIFIGNDTGMMHIAAAMQTPVAVIFGSSVRDFGFSPYRVSNCVIESEISCRPCSHIGRNSCPKGHFDCMKKLTPNLVFDEILKFTKNS
jgi:heptosyltransferase-2